MFVTGLMFSETPLFVSNVLVWSGLRLVPSAVLKPFLCPGPARVNRTGRVLWLNSPQWLAGGGPGLLQFTLPQLLEGSSGGRVVVWGGGGGGVCVRVRACVCVCVTHFQR